ncbi:MAG: hypothetical protein IJ100_03600 [Lachnospiraceae bacterium]|nr:hypothetical protein [Lachnospiraceae bacterium]
MQKVVLFVEAAMLYVVFTFGEMITHIFLIFAMNIITASLEFMRDAIHTDKLNETGRPQRYGNL